MKSACSKTSSKVVISNGIASKVGDSEATATQWSWPMNDSSKIHCGCGTRRWEYSEEVTTPLFGPFSSFTWNVWLCSPSGNPTPVAFRIDSFRHQIRKNALHLENSFFIHSISLSHLSVSFPLPFTVSTSSWLKCLLRVSICCPAVSFRSSSILITSTPIRVSPVTITTRSPWCETLYSKLTAFRTDGFPFSFLSNSREHHVASVRRTAAFLEIRYNEQSMSYEVETWSYLGRSLPMRHARASSLNRNRLCCSMSLSETHRIALLKAFSKFEEVIVSSKETAHRRPFFIVPDLVIFSFQKYLW